FDESGPEVDVRCPACAAEGAKRRLLVAQGVYSLYSCPHCGSSFYDPFPQIDYENHTPELVRRDYVEMNASIDFPTANILRLIPEGKMGRLLDVGCGFGFALDVARTLAGWKVRGFEPSQYGIAGRETLGLDIVNSFAKVNDDPEQLYDIVYCSE